jgi:hypothetical protein
MLVGLGFWLFLVAFAVCNAASWSFPLALKSKNDGEISSNSELANTALVATNIVTSQDKKEKIGVLFLNLGGPETLNVRTVFVHSVTTL